jgi:uncharacterized membrane protein
MTHPDPIDVAIVLLVGLLLHWVPLWRRHDLWFGVTVAPDFSDTPQARLVLRRYRRWVWLLTVVAVACVLAAGPLHASVLMAAAPIIQAVGAAAAFAVVRRSVLPFAARLPAIRSAPLQPTREGLPGGIVSLLVPLAMFAATALYLHAEWLGIPARFPAHWNIEGTPDRWADRSWRAVYGPLLTGGLVISFMFLVAEAIVHRSPRGRIAGTEAWTARFRRANLMLLVAAVWVVTATICFISLLPLLTGGGQPALIAGLVPLVLTASLAPFVVQLVRLTRDPTSASDGTPDKCWKLGQIYINPSDPALVVEKRFGLGYTLNFGNRALWWILMAAVLVFALVIGLR